MIKRVRRDAAGTVISLGIVVSFVLFVFPASAQTFSSPSYTIDASTMNTFGGSSTATSYKMESSGGEAIIGNGTAGSYKLAQGYVAQLEPSSEPPTLALYVQPSGLASYWPLDETTGTTAFDLTIDANDLPLINGPTWGTGKVGNGLVLDGTNDRAHNTSPVSMTANGGVKSVTAWIKTGVGKNQSVITFLGDNGYTSGYSLRLSNTGGTEVQVKVNGGAVVAQTVQASVVDGQWHHLAYTYDGTYHKIYYDGQFQHQSSLTPPATGSANEVCVGCLVGSTGFPTDFWNGTLDEIRVYDKALTADEVKAQYDVENTGVPSGINIGTITPGISQAADFDAIVDTNVSSYTLSISQDQSLTNGGSTIDPISGTIGSPLAWSEGTTKGLGFTLVSGSGISGIWNSGNSYAQLPSSASTFYTRTGYTPGTPDVLGMRLRVDTTTSQPSGLYSNVMTITGTTTP